MCNIDRYFLGLALLAALAGMGLGIWMSLANDYSLMPLHAHINLLGWVTFVLFALAYRTGLAKNDVWAAAHFWVSFAAIVIFSAGIWIALTLGRPKPAYVGAALMVASMMLFGINVLRAKTGLVVEARPARRGQPHARYRTVSASQSG